ncbi:hypothetical protein BCR43DRAFT_484370 [Syncephalastrum racemosum]|uniref:Uncharacterized protein n=1 Tax=Syncephalastrum racemosum TaxID=13706 RepID=A0A1X2HWR1_SYNRA|nr:hypothetical protein BCR43DRAFT_484370 [Syncephalastrum racemosum]
MRFVLLSLLLATLALSALSAPTAPTAGESQVAPSKEDNGVQLQDTGSLNRRQEGADKKGGILGGALVPGIL